MKIRRAIKSSKPLEYNSIYTDYGIYNNFKSLPTSVKFEYPRKREINRIILLVVIFAIFSLLCIVGIFDFDLTFYLFLLLCVSFVVFIGWFQLGDEMVCLLKADAIIYNDYKILWESIIEINRINFNVQGDHEEFGIFIQGEKGEQIIIRLSEIKVYNHDKKDLPQIIYMFWRRAIKSNNQ